MGVPIIIRCHSCGFVLAVIGKEAMQNGVPSIEVILRQWGYRCPVCLSPLSKTPIRWEVG
jgi:uncharacterized protein with PIN domain